MQPIASAETSRIAMEMELPEHQVRVAVSLLQSDNTVPFLTRYRRDETGGLDEVQLRRIQQRLQQLTSLRERKASILKSIQSQTELSETLRQKIENCYSLKLLEDLYLPYKQKKTSWAQQARELGLQPLAEAVLLEGLTEEDFENEIALAEGPDGEKLDPELVLKSVRCLVGEAIVENAELRSRLRRAAWKEAKLCSVRLPSSTAETAKTDGNDDNRSDHVSQVAQALTAGAEDAGADPSQLRENPTSAADTIEASTKPTSSSSSSKRKRKRKKKRREEERYKDYFEYSEPVKSIPPHRVLAVNRGEKEKKLKVRIELPEERLWQICRQLLISADHPQRSLMLEVGREVLNRSLLPALEREIRRELTEKAEEHAIEVFTTNLRSLLLQPPIKGYRVLALDPGFKTGCKAAVLDEQGNFLASETVSIVGNQQKREDALQKLTDLVQQNQVNLIAIGNGTGCRETELLVSELISGPMSQHELKYVIANEAGASIYSTSEIGREELPDVDPTIRSAISIGRRVLDPLSELVKIDPAHIGVGLYQHDVKSRHLAESLDAIVESCVNFVGVDANTASPALLRYVAGLNQATARKICEHRQQYGPFANREALKEVSGIGNATFVQCAGFLRIHGSDQPLDATAIHPESYHIAQAVLDRIQGPKTAEPAGFLDQQLAQPLASLDTERLAEEMTIGRLRLKDIIEVLGRPGRDPRDSVPPPVFRSGVLDIEDLSLGMHLRGQVLNVVDFGIFVDIGLGESGLVHISNLSTGYIRDPHQFFSVGDVLNVWVESIDRKLKRVSLSAIDPSQANTKSESEDESRTRRSPAAGKEKSERRKKRPRKRSTNNGNSQSTERKHGPNQRRRSSHRRSTAPPSTPISEEAAQGKVPLRSFSELAQFVSQSKPQRKKGT